MGGPLPPALMCTAIGLMLAFASPSCWRTSFVLLVPCALAAAFVPLPIAWTPTVFSLCFISALLTSGSVHLPGGPPSGVAIVLALNGGIWAGLTAAAGGGVMNLAVALPLALLALPGAWLVQKGAGIAVKVLASWLVAIAILGSALPFAPTLLGYQPDHLE